MRLGKCLKSRKQLKATSNRRKTCLNSRANESKAELARAMPGAAEIIQHRTDGSDAFNTLYIGCEKFPYRDSFALSVSGVS